MSCYEIAVGVASGIWAVFRGVASHRGIDLVCTRKLWKDWRAKSHPSMLLLCHIWQAHAECQFPPIRTITSALLPEGREERERQDKGAAASSHSRVSSPLFSRIPLSPLSAPFCRCPTKARCSVNYRGGEGRGAGGGTEARSFASQIHGTTN